MALTLVPAYGRDYKSKAEVLTDSDGGKDFMAVGFGMPARGLATSKKDLIEQGHATVNIRYQRQTKVMVVNLKE